MPDGGEGDEVGSSGFFDNLMPSPEAYEQPLTILVADAMNWKSVLTHEKARLGQFDSDKKYYIVVFRSIRSKNADLEKLYAADALAHDEAKKSGGLLRYWYGILNSQRECLAMCIWESREQALAALHLPAHRVAMELAKEMYDAYILERYWLIPGPDGSPIIEQLPGSPHGLSSPGALKHG